MVIPQQLILDKIDRNKALGYKGEPPKITKELLEQPLLYVYISLEWVNKAAAISESPKVAHLTEPHCQLFHTLAAFGFSPEDFDYSDRVCHLH